MKIETEFTTNLDGKRYYHFWLIPSIEIDREHLNNEVYGKFKWIQLTLSWLFWTIDIEILN